MRAKVLYDFAGEATSEISIFSGETLTVTRTDVGEGWWEGINSKGQTGLFPAAYVEPVPETTQQNNNMSQPPPPIAPAPRYDQTADDVSEPHDDWEDDWDEGDDQDTYSEIGPPPPKNASSAHQQQSRAIYENAVLPPTPASDDTISMTSTSVPVKRSKMFAKSGDAYILGTSSPNVSENERVYVIQSEAGYIWRSMNQPYSVTVTSPKKETKFKGIKTFIAYQLTPTFNNIVVSRRYKHFDWLHKILVDKFCLIPIPPLPDKQVSGRYEDSFVEHRRVQLQEFVDWVCRHPVVAHCEVFLHFLTCTDEKKWKNGKRAAEKDPLVGPTYCAAIFPPEKMLLASVVDQQTDNCTAFVHSMDTAVKNLMVVSFDLTKKFQTQGKKDFQRIGEGFSDLARSLEIDERRAVTSTCLSKSVGKAAAIFIKIGQQVGDQPRYDWIPFSDELHIYRGILSCFPDILSVHKNAMSKRKECEKLTAEQKMGNAQMQDVVRRTDVMSYSLMAELSHFRAERDTHMKEAMKKFIGEQIKFYQTIVNELQMAQQFFDE